MHGEYNVKLQVTISPNMLEIWYLETTPKTDRIKKSQIGNADRSNLN
jgi:hypothetical protein